jgi:hypothetical protein
MTMLIFGLYHDGLYVGGGIAMDVDSARVSALLIWLVSIMLSVMVYVYLSSSTSSSSSSTATTKNVLVDHQNNKWLSSPSTCWFLLLIVSASVVAIPNFIAFSHSQSTGFALLSLIYPYPQNSEPFERFPFPIYIHIFFNCTALIIGAIQLYPLMSSSSPPSSSSFTRLLQQQQPQNQLVASSRGIGHRVMGTVYVISLIIGSIGSITYAWSRTDWGNDGGRAAQYSFIAMSMGSLIPSLAGVWCISVGQPKDKICRYVSHSHWMMRSYASLFGSAVLFRLLANLYLPYTSGYDRYASWIVMIWASWIIPLLIMEHFISRRVTHIISSITTMMTMMAANSTSSTLPPSSPTTNKTE